MPTRVLVVDDDPLYLQSIAEILEDAGYEAATAASFEEGKRAIKERKPDLLILDVRLGAHNGLQFISSGEPKTRAIVMTGFDDPVLRADAVSFGARFLVKPVEPRVLLSVIKEELASAAPGQ